MIEVLFGESEAASMKAAKNREVICFGFMLDIGSIKESVDSQYRKSLIASMNAGDCSDELLRLKTYLEEGETIRIWYSDAPYSRCGFYSLCRMLQNCENEVYAIKLPEHVVRKRSIISYRNWGEVSTEEFAGFLSQERRLTKEEIRMYAFLWTELTEDNSPLRAVINGRIMGVPADFYDFLIWKRLGCRPIKEARLIGDILGYFRPGVGDWWFAERIDYYIQQGKIRVIEDSENKYARMVSLADEGEVR